MLDRHPLLAKALALVAITLLLALLLTRIEQLVRERQWRQAEAVLSVQQSFAAEQVLLGPLLARQCVETWSTASGSGRERRTETHRRETLLQAVPQGLEVKAAVTADARYRGLFKVNGYLARLGVDARFADLAQLVPAREQPGSTMHCDAPLAWAAVSDLRGVRAATLALAGRERPVRPGSGLPQRPRGLHAVLDDAGFLPGGEAPTEPVTLRLTLDVVGTGQLGLVPAADATRFALRADWPHPSFGGRFLPVAREVRDDGFSATWQVSSLASAAGTEALAGRTPCPPNKPAPPNSTCLDTLAVDFIDPVNPYSLSDRATKYGLLFVVLTFAAVALTETLAPGRVRRVHPVQYGLVGAALALFFLLLLSLAEHLGFMAAYGLAAAACVLLLAVYARHMLGSWRGGVGFGAAIALLYALLYVLLQREQTALVIGAVGLFAALAVVMWLTRRVDWYRLGQTSDVARPTSPPEAGAPASTAGPAAE